MVFNFRVDTETWTHATKSSTCFVPVTVSSSYFSPGCHGDSWTPCWVMWDFLCSSSEADLAVVCCARRVCIRNIWKWKRRWQSLRNSLPRNQQQNGECGHLGSVVVQTLVLYLAVVPFLGVCLGYEKVSYYFSCSCDDFLPPSGKFCVNSVCLPFSIIAQKY